MAAQHGYQIVAEFTDKLSSMKAELLGLKDLMCDALGGTAVVFLSRPRAKRKMNKTACDRGRSSASPGRWAAVRKRIKS
jgi:hypothetical protein